MKNSVVVRWMHQVDLGYYSWCAVKKDGTVLTRNHRQCFQCLDWCDRHGVEVEDVIDDGTRR